MGSAPRSTSTAHARGPRALSSRQDTCSHRSLAGSAPCTRAANIPRSAPRSPPISPSELAVCIARRRDPPHRRFEGRVFKVEVNPELRAQVGMPIRDHVDPFDRRNLLDILQALKRLDRRAYDDVLVGPRRVFSGVAGAVALVSRVRPLAGDTPVSDWRILRQADDRARLLGVFHLGHLDAHDALIQNAWD